MQNEWDKWKPLSLMDWESGPFSWFAIYNLKFTIGNYVCANISFGAEVGKT